MATSRENGTFKNPIRAHPSGGLSYERQNNVFEKQRPGMIVQVAEQNAGLVVYRCTNEKTKNFPIWEKIVNDGLDGKPVLGAGQYIWVKTGKPGKSNEKFTVRTISGAKIEYEDNLVKDKLERTRLDNSKAWGNFVFIRLSSLEIDEITSGGTTDAPSRIVPPTVDQPGVDKDFLEELGKSNEAWDNFYGKKYTTPREFEGFDPGRPSGVREFEGFDPGDKYRVPREFEGWSSGSSGSSNPSTNTPSTGSSQRRGDNRKNNQTPSSKSTVTVQINTRDFNSGIAYNNAAPYMEQKFSVYERTGATSSTRTDIVRRHAFELIPNSFEFSQLNSTWNEVPRSGNYPYVDWSNYNLTKVSFRFLVTGTRTTAFGPGFFSGQPLNDGIDVSIDEQIDNIRSMAAAPSPIRIYNMNTLLTNTFRYPFLQKAGGISWVIADMSIVANRLTPNGKEIAAAEVSITLNEYPIIARDIIRIPKLRPGSGKPECCPPPKTDPQRDLWTNTYTFVPTVSSIAYPQPKG
jgi:hypothetical protein